MATKNTEKVADPDIFRKETMTTKTITAAARRAFLRQPWRKPKIGAADSFALFTAKNYETVAQLPFKERAATLAKAYAEQSPVALATLKATAQKNAEARQKAREAVKGATGFGLFTRDNKELYATLGFNGFSSAVATKWAALSDSQKATYAKKAAARNEAVEKYIQANI